MCGCGCIETQSLYTNACTRRTVEATDGNIPDQHVAAPARHARYVSVE